MTFAKAARLAICLLCIPAIQGCVGAVATGAAATAVALQDRRTPGTVIDDQLVEFSVLKAILSDEAMSSQTHINATSFNGFVLLTGEAPGKQLRTRATEIARRLPKVRAVQNEIALQAPSTLLARSADALVTAKVKAVLLKEGGGPDAAPTKVVTERGIVYLMGLLRQNEADWATEVARRVPGVQRVVPVFEYIK